MNRAVLFFVFAVVVAIVGLVLPYRSNSQQPGGATNDELVARGRYLVSVASCNDCHSPKVFGPMGPVPDTTRLLSGSPANQPIPKTPKNVLAPDKWGALASNDMTIWRGPWGTSFTRNLTPDTTTGLGSWTPEMFIKTIRTGKHMGEGRNLLPPMPWPEYAHMTDGDLRAIFAYLHSLKPIENAVHDPIPPPAPPTKK